MEKVLNTNCQNSDPFFVSKISKVLLTESVKIQCLADFILNSQFTVSSPFDMV